MMKKTVSIAPGIRRIWLLSSVLLVAGIMLAAGAARSQEVAAPDLEALVAPIALYPDDVLGIVLPASTFPLDIVRAARFLEQLELDPTLAPDESWDESIVALLNYPEIVRMMDEDLDWTWSLGEAVLTDETAVLAAAQDFRQRALAAGNLPSDDKQLVTESEGVIEITPADPEVVYIPVYEPQEVVVYQPTPVYRYYPAAYPVYYYPYPVGYYFPSRFFWGVTSYFSIGWQSHYLHVHHHSHRLHPYYLNSYYLYRPYYYRNNVVVTVSSRDYTNVWRPNVRRGGNRPRTLTQEGRVSGTRTARTSTVETQPGTLRRRPNGTNTASANSSNSTATTTRSVPSSSARIRGVNPGDAATATTRPRTNSATPAPRTPSGTLSTRTRSATTTQTNPSSARTSRSSGGSIGGVSRSSVRPSSPPRSTTTTRMAPPAVRTAPTQSSAPTRAAPVRTAPTSSAPTRSAPARSAPARSAPARSAPARSAPTRSAPSRSAPSPRSARR